jgi:hypothetical protein
MGAMRDSVIGTTKVATWIAFKQSLRRQGLDTPQGQAEQGMYLERPRNKREAYKQMIREPQGWRLWYRLHS